MVWLEIPKDISAGTCVDVLFLLDEAGILDVRLNIQGRVTEGVFVDRENKKEASMYRTE